METQTISINEKTNHAEKTLKNVLKDVENVQSYLQNGLIIKKIDGVEIAFKVESQKIKDLTTLSNSLKNDVVKYAFGKRIKATATRELNNFLVESKTQQ